MAVAGVVGKKNRRSEGVLVGGGVDWEFFPPKRSQILKIVFDLAPISKWRLPFLDVLIAKPRYFIGAVGNDLL